MPLKRTLIGASILIFTAVFLQFIHQSEDVHPNRPFSTFPKVIENWEGYEDRFDDRVYDVLGVDDSYLGHYKDRSTGDYVQLYIGFHQSQKEGDLIHSPKNCMPGGGWKITKIEKEEIETSNYGKEKAKVIKLILEKGLQRQAVLYWYQSRGRIISSEYLQKIYLVIDSVTKRRTDGSFVRLIAPYDGGKEAETIDMLKDFAKAIFPSLLEYIPS